MKSLDVLLVEPQRHPKVVTIDGSLRSMQKLVGGNIEHTYPFDDDAALVCCEESKLNGMTPNRAVYRPDGNLGDIVCGSFFIVGAPDDSDSFESLTEGQIQRYEAMFYQPQMFVRTTNGIEVTTCGSYLNARYSNSDVKLIATYEELIVVPYDDRLTKWWGDIGLWVFKDFITPNDVEAVYRRALEAIGLTEDDFKAKHYVYREDIEADMKAAAGKRPAAAEKEPAESPDIRRPLRR